jgi:ribonuclease HII
MSTATSRASKKLTEEEREAYVEEIESAAISFDPATLKEEIALTANEHKTAELVAAASATGEVEAFGRYRAEGCLRLAAGRGFIE